MILQAKSPMSYSGTQAKRFCLVLSLNLFLGLCPKGHNWPLSQVRLRWVVFARTGRRINNFEGSRNVPNWFLI